MSAELLGARAIRELLGRHRIRLKKSLGQNFVVDPNTIRKVVSLANLDGSEHVLEIGAGAGSLTVALAAAAGAVTAVEIDRRLEPMLDEVVGDLDNVQVVFADAMDVDLGGLDASKVVANLPYNLAASVVIRVLREAPRVVDLTVMTQREVGERLAAASGSDAYGLPSVLVAFHGHASVAARISRNAFFPVPAVDSVVVRIERRPQPEVDPADFRALVGAAFGQRRKTLRRSLMPVVGSAEATERVLAAAEVDPSARPETVSLEGFVALARAFERAKTG